MSERDTASEAREAADDAGRDQEQKPPEQEQAELRRDIERTRAELGETVEALTQRADVKTQAKERVDEVKTQAREKAEQVKTQAQGKVEELQQKLPEQTRDKPVVPIAAGIGVSLVALWLIRRR
jgi:ElaB/YqjD/DUF883 family membrane-anchored ribosome-binding protein